MIEIKGQFNFARIFADKVDETALNQIKILCDQEFVKDSVIRIMPDTHAGAGCTIGTTMTIKDKIVPNLVGVDIGCGMETLKLSNTDIDLVKLDRLIHDNIPSGFNIRDNEHSFNKNLKLEDLKCRKDMNINRAKKSIGTLGGGNHFIELNKDKKGSYYLVIHSGSRYLGKEVALYYQNIGYKKLMGNKDEINEMIERLKSEGREKEIKKEIKKIKKPLINKQLAYIENDDFNNYLHDMKIVQQYAVYNRKAIANDIVKLMNLNIDNVFTTIHNYIDVDSMILRKGAVSAYNNEILLIPINMRDGSLICVGKGNKEWNYSAPHGAGRIMSRKQAVKKLGFEDFKESMKGIYSSTVVKSTIDESPFAYKPMNEIIDNIYDTVEIKDIIRPVYNFKAIS